MSGFTKLFSSIVTSTIWQEDPETKVVWITLLALADAEGFVDATTPGLANIANISIEKTRKAVEKLEAPDPDSRTVDYGGRRITKVEGGWVLLNYLKYRKVRDPEERKEYMRNYMKNYRKQNVNNVNRSKTKLAQAEAEAEAEAEAKKENLNINTNKVTGRNTSVTDVTVTDFTLPPNLEMWKNYAFQAGLTDSEAQNSYDNFGANGWKRGNGVKIESWKQVPGLLRYWRNNRQNFTPKNKPTESAYDQVSQLKARGEL